MLIEKIKHTIKKYRLIHKGDKIVIGVSGGPDSLSLLYVLNSLKKEFRLSLQVAHLDHMLRRDSPKDAEFVARIARKLNLPIATARINVKELAKEGGSLEEIARNARLGFLFKTARDFKAKKVALGHNLDDQAETVLMRILRGTGLYGLSAISPKRNIAGFEVIRPLIEVSRKEVELFLKKKKIKPRIDISNLGEVYFRNKIRNRLLPLLARDYNKNIKEILANMAEIVAFDYDFLNLKARMAMRKFGRRINTQKFLGLHPAIQRLVLRLSIARLKGNTRRLTAQHIKEIEDLILNRPVNSIVDLPGGVSVSKKKTYLCFYLRKA